MTQPQKPPQEVKIRLPGEVKAGAYCNSMLVRHMKEEFIMDFILAIPPEPVVTARVIMSPGHMKRTIAALQDNLAKYEKQFGKIEAAPEPATKGKLGFRTS